MYDFLDAMITQQTSPEEVCLAFTLSFVIFFELSLKHRKPSLRLLERLNDFCSF